MWRLGFVFSLVIRMISSDILTWSSALTWHTYTPVTCHASRVTCNIVTYPRVWAAADQSWGHRRWAHSVLDAGTGGCSYHCRASCMPRLVRRKEERGNVILLMLNFKLSTLFDYSPLTPPRSMSQGMVKLTASDAVSRTFSPWMLMEIKLSRKKSYKKAQHCYRMISFEHRKFESRLFTFYEH